MPKGGKSTSTSRAGCSNQTRTQAARAMTTQGNPASTNWTARDTANRSVNCPNTSDNCYRAQEFQASQNK